ncbi:MAG: OmpH family outer membrane protein [Bacteriovoracaceae bacterium]|jgi:outer membrane protein|nr:OmpH family outer membrane protein [Bacteriovoracaceae bacterium]
MKYLVFLSLFFVGISFSHANTVIGLINMEAIINKISDGKKIRSKLEKEFNKKKKTLQKEEETIKKAQENYKKQSVVLNDKAKMKKEEEITNMIRGIQQKTMAYQKEIRDLEAKLKKPLLKKIQAIVDTVSKKENVAMTFEVSTSPVIYAKEKKDLTGKIIEAYNKKYKK